MLLNALIEEASPGYPNTNLYVVPYLFIIIPHLMRVLLDCLIFLENHAFSSSASVQVISTVKVYF